MKKLIILLLVAVSLCFSEVFKCELFPHYKDKNYAVFAYTLEAAYIDGVLRGKITHGQYTKECWNDIESEVHLTAETRGVVISEFTAHGNGYTDPLEYNPRSKRPYTHWYITDTFYWKLSPAELKAIKRRNHLGQTCLELGVSFVNGNGQCKDEDNLAKRNYLSSQE